jgi:hypothetical protein
MKKTLITACVLLGLLLACTQQNNHLPDVDGMWQLKSIEDPSGRVQVVDTVYFGFQARKLFTYTQLNTFPEQSDPTMICYGYVDFPDPNYMYIYLDPLHEFYAPWLLWRSERITYLIRKLSSEEMILENDGNVYRLIKF